MLNVQSYNWLHKNKRGAHLQFVKQTQKMYVLPRLCRADFLNPILYDMPQLCRVDFLNPILYDMPQSSRSVYSGAVHPW
jgi:hypothetical protein